jgi:hypothetical protein
MWKSVLSISKVFGKAVGGLFPGRLFHGPAHHRREKKSSGSRARRGCGRSEFLSCAVSSADVRAIWLILFLALRHAGESGMIEPELRVQIRRYFFAEHWKIGTIAKQLQVHPDTVRREGLRLAPICGKISVCCFPFLSVRIAVRAPFQFSSSATTAVTPFVPIPPTVPLRPN